MRYTGKNHLEQWLLCTQWTLAISKQGGKNCKDVLLRFEVSKLEFLLNEKGTNLYTNDILILNALGSQHHWPWAGQGRAGDAHQWRCASSPGDCVSHSPWPGRRPWSARHCADAGAWDPTWLSHCCLSPMIHLKYHNTIQLMSLKLILLKYIF